MEEIAEAKSLKEIVNINFETYKDRVAFLEKDGISKGFQKIKYSKVKSDINALGTVMINKLNLKDKKIAVIGENSYNWYITYMAVVCGVGIIVPLDKELPANEILNLLKRSDSKCIVYSSRKKDIIEEIKDKLPDDMIFIEMSKPETKDNIYSLNELLDKGNRIVESGDNSYENIEIDNKEFRILLFTSGTTGNPKGVMLCHKNLCSNMYNSVPILPKIKDYTCLSVLPIHHTYEFTLSYLLFTYVGGTVAICEGLKYISKNLQEAKPDCIFAVPALIEKMCKKIENGIKETGKEAIIKTMAGVTTGLSKIGIDLRRNLFKKIQDNFGGNLRYIFCGAAPLNSDVIKKMESFGFTFLQGYGLTETSPLLAGTTPKDRVAGTVGKPIRGVEIRIDLSSNTDENSNVGEIMVKGDNIMLGYYENDDETKKVLRKGWFYTGDIGYFDLRGNLVVSGRSKNVIVTSNGKNIFPEEIETEINKIALIEDSMVYGVEDKKHEGGLMVCAKVTLNEEYIENEYMSNRPSDEKIYEIIWAEIKKINRSMVPYKAIKKLEIKKDEFSKTTTMKIKRFEEIKK